MDHLQQTSILSPYAIFMPADSLAYPRRDSIFIPPRLPDPEATEPIEKRVEWDSITLGNDPELKVGISAITENGKDAVEVNCRILINSNEVASRVISSTLMSQHSWIEFQADLSEYAGKDVRLTLAADSPSDFPGIYWGEPVIMMESPK